jgi:DNA-binding transcriptional regulator YhcF (GntR family)
MSDLQKIAWDKLVVVEKTKFVDNSTFQPKIRITLEIGLEYIMDLKALGISHETILEYLKNKLQEVYLQK